MTVMRREPLLSHSDDTVIWISALLLAALLGALSAFTVTVAATGAPDLGTSLKEMLGLIGAGVLLIVLALHGKLIRAFLASFAIVFFVVLAIASHGFSQF